MEDISDGPSASDMVKSLSNELNENENEIGMSSNFESQEPSNINISVISKR